MQTAEQGECSYFLSPNLFEAKHLLANREKGVHSLYVLWEKSALTMPMSGNAVP